MSDMLKCSLGYLGAPRSTADGNYLLGNGYRSYNPVLKRFFSWDRSSPFGMGGTHGYNYCNGNPARLSDPSGRGPIEEDILFLVDILVVDGVEDTAGSVAIAAEVGVDAVAEVDEASALTSFENKMSSLPNEMVDQIYSYLDEDNLNSVSQLWKGLETQVEEYKLGLNKRSFRKLTERIDSRLSNFKTRSALSDDVVASVLQRAWGSRKMEMLSESDIKNMFDIYLNGNNKYEFSRERGVTKVMHHANVPAQPQIPYIEPEQDFFNLNKLMMLGML